MMATCRALPRVLARGATADRRVRPGADLRADPATAARRAAARWWQQTLTAWGSLLDVVVWLDASDAVLLERIDARDKEHRLKGAGITRGVAVLARRPGATTRTLLARLDGRAPAQDPHCRGSTPAAQVSPHGDRPPASSPMVPRRPVARLRSQRCRDDTLSRKASLNMPSPPSSTTAPAWSSGSLVSPVLVSRLGDVVYGVYQTLGRLVGYATPAGGRPSQALKWTIARHQHSTEYDEKRLQVGSALAVWLVFLPAAGPGGRAAGLVLARTARPRPMTCT